jgi:hypothetical protein
LLMPNDRAQPHIDRLHCPCVCVCSYNMSAELATYCIEQMRIIGVRRDNAFKNIGMLSVVVVLVHVEYY